MPLPAMPWTSQLSFADCKQFAGNTATVNSAARDYAGSQSTCAVAMKFVGWSNEMQVLHLTAVGGTLKEKTNQGH